MKLFDKRPLSLILCIALGGFVVFSLFDTYVRLIPIIFVPILAAIPFIFKFSRRRRLLSLLCSVFLLLSVLLSYLYFDLYFKAEDRFEGEVTVSGTVTETAKSSAYSTSYIIKANSINGEALSSYRLIFYLSPEQTDNIVPGTKIRLKATLLGFDTDRRDYYYAKGVSASLENISELTVTEEGDLPISETFAFLRDYLTRHAIYLSDYESGSMVSALLVGERS